MQLAGVRILWAVGVQRAPCVPKPAPEPLPARSLQLPAGAPLRSWHSFLCFLYIQNYGAFPAKHWQLPPGVQECAPSPSVRGSAAVCVCSDALPQPREMSVRAHPNSSCSWGLMGHTGGLKLGPNGSFDLSQELLSPGSLHGLHSHTA